MFRVSVFRHWYFAFWIVVNSNCCEWHYIKSSDVCQFVETMQFQSALHRTSFYLNSKFMFCRFCNFIRKLNIAHSTSPLFYYARDTDPNNDFLSVRICSRHFQYSWFLEIFIIFQRHFQYSWFLAIFVIFQRHLQYSWFLAILIVFQRHLHCTHDFLQYSWSLHWDPCNERRRSLWDCLCSTIPVSHCRGDNWLLSISYILDLQWWKASNPAKNTNIFKVVSHRRGDNWLE